MAGMAPPFVSCIAVIGRNNNPLYLKSFSVSDRGSQPSASKAYTEVKDLRFHYLVHSSLDLIEEKVGGPKSGEMYLGYLYAFEDQHVYGYITNTKIKFVIIISTPHDTVYKANDILQLFQQLHAAYITLVSNPFFVLESTAPISSQRFHNHVRAIAESFVY